MYANPSPKNGDKSYNPGLPFLTLHHLFQYIFLLVRIRRITYEEAISTRRPNMDFMGTQAGPR
jgi:hypothetical protein